MEKILDRLKAVERRYEELNHLLAESGAEQERWQSFAQEQAAIEPLVSKFRRYKGTLKELEETQHLLDDSLDTEMVALVKQEIEELKKRGDDLMQELRLALLPQDTNINKDAIVEIRAGTGGEEAALFAADLFRMYTRYAQAKGWKIDVIDSNQSDRGGFKEIVFEVTGRNAFGKLKYERGVHRVQRVPATEASGRIHTSTATVAVLPEAEEIEVNINPDDLKVEIFRSSGPGGQHANKVATAVRLSHLPTGITAICQDERSQSRNRMKAMTVLRARLLDREQRKQQEEITRERRSQVGSAERAEKVRTYNFPQSRVTDHRIGLTLHNLPAILQGELDDLIDALATDERAKMLEEAAG
ncbi:MAG: peptide chain release factor 1 [Dehalococcoidia bacterium]|nr:MAG: peptide chain release factor 1 [Dehalococcoidia bacterium]